MTNLDDIHDLMLRMEDICHEGGMPRFDRVRLVSDPGKPPELWFLWEETKQIVIVECDRGADGLVDALAAATAGDPVLN